MHLYLYQPLLIWLIIASVFEYFKPQSKLNKVFFAVSMSIMTLMVIFRYGQGPDYMGYKKLYVEAPQTFEYALQYFFNVKTHFEIGFKVFSYIFRLLRISSFWFFGILGTVTMSFITSAIIQYATRLNLASLIFYPTLFLTYVMSGVRQAFSTSLFLCFGIKLLSEKKYVKYALLILLCSCFHRFSLILLILIPLSMIKEKKLLVLVPVVIAAGMVYTFATPIHRFLAEHFNESSQLYRLTQVNVSWLGLAERTVSFGIITFLFFMGTQKDTGHLLYRIYIVGYLINVLLMTTDYGSQRISMPMKMVEIVLIPALLTECSKKVYRLLATGAIIAVETVMTLKNLHFYDPDYNFINYPYISVINEEHAFSDKEDKTIEWEEMWEQWYESYPAGSEYINFYLKQRFGS